MKTLLIAVLCLIFGLLAGRMTARKMKSGTVAQPDAATSPEVPEETERLREEQQAFSIIMGYNADVAYGMDSSRKAAFERM